MLWAKAIPSWGFWAFITTLSTKIAKKKKKTPSKNSLKIAFFIIFSTLVPHKVIDCKVLLNFV